MQHDERDPPLRWGPKMDIIDAETGATVTIDRIPEGWVIVDILLPLAVSEEQRLRIHEHMRNYFDLPDAKPAD